MVLKYGVLYSASTIFLLRKYGKDSALVKEDSEFHMYTLDMQHFLERGWNYFKDFKDMFFHGCHFLDEKMFPSHFLFANFQCLRCVECCKHYDCIEVTEEQIENWEVEGRYDILRYVDTDLKEIVSEDFEGDRTYQGCPLCKKARNKPYYGCRIHDNKPQGCRGFLCRKSIPVSHINYQDVEDLIKKIGLERYLKLVEWKGEWSIR
jgi:hypothetical protein